MSGYFTLIGDKGLPTAHKKREVNFAILTLETACSVGVLTVVRPNQ